MRNNRSPVNRSKWRLTLALAVATALGVFLVTYSGVRKSRADTLSAIRAQGESLLDALITASDNALRVNRKAWDRLVANAGAEARDALAASAAKRHHSPAPNTVAIFEFDDHLTLHATTLTDSAALPTGASETISSLAASAISDRREFTIATLEDASVVAVVYDTMLRRGAAAIISQTESRALEREIGVGALIQRLGKSRGVRYILLQSPDGIIFSSTPIDSAPAIRSDDFLAHALQSDTSVARIFRFLEEETLELASAYESSQYGPGVFRLGLSLERYHEINAGFTRQMIFLGAALFVGLALLAMYFEAQRERLALGASLARAGAIAGTMVERMNAGALVVDETGRIELINAPMRVMFGLGAGVIEGQNWRDTPLAKALPEDIVAHSRTPLAPREIQYEHDGGIRYILLSRAPFEASASPGAKDVERGVVIIAYDYTSQRAAEADLARRERLIELGNLAASVAHEIRNPLNAISLSAQRLAAEYSDRISGDKGDFDFFVRQIRQESQRLNTIVTRFLDISRAPATPNPLAAPEALAASASARPCDIGAIVREWAHFMAPSFARDKANVQFSVAEKAIAHANPEALRQALDNLYRNAVEATLTVSDGARIQVAVESDDRWTSVSVSDNGPGVSSEARARLFTPYATTKPDGAGLGLAISYRLAHDMGGELALDEKYMDGARFVLHLARPAPLTPPTPLTPPVRQERAAG